jgi:hypothetical protein
MGDNENNSNIYGFNPPATSAAAGTPMPAPAPVQRQKIKVPRPNPINALLGRNLQRPISLVNANQQKALRTIRGEPQITEIKTSGPPYYFRITRAPFSALYKSNEYPTPGTTITARGLQMFDDKPVWIEADVDVEIPTSDPTTGTITMLNCPSMTGGGMCVPCKTRKHRIARRKQRKSRKQRK